MIDAKRQLHDRIVKEFADRGQIVEAGWMSFKLLSIPDDAPKLQLDEMRLAYMAGAQHLWGSIMSLLEPGTEPTDNDMRRMDLISNELADYARRVKLEVTLRKSHE